MNTKHFIVAATILLTLTSVLADPVPPTDPPDGFGKRTAIVKVFYLPTGTTIDKVPALVVTGCLLSLNDQGYVHIRSVLTGGATTKPTDPIAAGYDDLNNQVGVSEVLIPVNSVIVVKKMNQ